MSDEPPRKPHGPIGWLVEQHRIQSLERRRQRSVILWPGHLLFLIPAIVAIAAAFVLPTFLALVSHIVQCVQSWVE